jgi:uncharacterized protein
LRPVWSPVAGKERYNSLDLLRGFALYGVLIVNLLYFFRISIFTHIFAFHSHPGWANHAIDEIVSQLIEFKSFALFSLSFGIGVGVQADRAHRRGVAVETFLARRFLVLLAFGICHMVLIANVDILILYVVCGLALIPLLRLPAWLLAMIGLAAIFLPSAVSRLAQMPPSPEIRVHAELATRMYAHAGFASLVEFRWAETLHYIVPLLVGVAQESFGLMLVGIAVWRSGVVREPARFRKLLWGISLVTGAIGLGLHQHVPLAFAYGAALLAWRAPALAPFAALGRMALTNYLMQSVVFALVFYGYGLGLFGRLDPLTAAVFGTAFYVCQLWFSKWWLSRYRFGPCEWVWRSLTYGTRI